MVRQLLLIALLLTLGVGALGQVVASPALMNFQGRLTRPDGTPIANGNYSVRFSLWTAVTGGTEKWNQTVNPVTVRNGTFAVLLNVASPADLFNTNLWLEIKIGTAAALTPRQQLVSVAFAMKANTVPDSSITSAKIVDGTITSADLASGTLNSLSWLLGGNTGTNPASQFVGTRDNQPLNVRVNNRRALRIGYVEDAAASFRSFNFLGGAEVNSIGANVQGATIAGGGYMGINAADLPNVVNASFGTIGGGYFNTISLNASNGVIGGGFQNFLAAGANDAAIAGGLSNSANAPFTFVGGGESNIAGGTRSVVGGGANNLATGAGAAIGGGGSNNASAQYAAITGGNGNLATGIAASIGGGNNNQATRTEATVGGGKINRATAEQATISGGENNQAAWAYATIGGGVGNVAINASATIAGGASNRAEGPVSAIGGGSGNSSYGRNSVIAGGNLNASRGDYASIGGGSENGTAGTYATIPGGYYNYAGGIGSFAAGIRAVANHGGSFVWADNHDVDFVSTASNQFAIRAYGGMVLETGQNAFLYTSSTAGEKNRYFLLLNSFQTPSASGLKAGGILCADDYGYANPAKNNMIIKGTLGIGYNNPSPYNLAVNGSTFSLSGYAGSDARWKRDITSLDNALDKILQLRGVSFLWDKATAPNLNFPEGKQIGFIAQEVEKILPELVSTDGKGYKAVAYASLVPVLVEAIKQQQAQIAGQQKQIEEMKTVQNENAELKTALLLMLQRIERLEANTERK